jgi:ribonuclease P protein component
LRPPHKEPGDLRFPPQLRLRKKAEFEAIRGRGRRFGNAHFALTLRPNELGVPRLGLAVAVRMAGGAVERNRLRRIIRESFRLAQREFPAVDLVVSARPPARGAEGAELRASLAALWEKVKQPCVSSPRS